MEEQLFDTPPGSEEEATPPPKAPEGTPASGAGDGTDERFAALESAIAETNQSVMSLTRSLAASVQRANEAEQATDMNTIPDMDEFRSQLVDDPAGTIDRRAEAVVNRLAGEQLTPMLTTIIETTHDSLMAKHEAIIEDEFGQEAWTKVVEPAVKEDVGRLREHNIRALADPGAIKALVDRQIGMNWKDLSAKQATHSATQRKTMEEEVSRGLPTGGNPRARMNTDVPDEDIKTFWADIEKATGEKVDQKTFMKLHNTGNSIDDYLKVVAGNK